jgi:magnesium transporter
MDLDAQLAMGLLQHHPEEAAGALERLPPEDAAALLVEAAPQVAAAVMGCIAPHPLGAVLSHTEVSALAEIVAKLESGDAARVLRRAAEATREAVLAGLPARTARSLRTLLRYAPNTAGALLDPDVLALPVDLGVKEALARIREHPEDARYNIYVVDRGQLLVGVFNMRELLTAPPQAMLRGIMKTTLHRLPGHADRRQIVSHPGWRFVHALPVVDEQGVYLGAIRFHALRRIEQELSGSSIERGATARALGELFATGAASLVEAVVGDPETRGSIGDGR